MAASYTKIDPIYKKYSSKVISALASTEFYEYFMSVMAAAKNTFQFSNRRIEKTVDEHWVIAIEEAIKPMQEVINNPRNFIVSEEIISNIALVKKIEPDSIRHLAQHGNMIDEVTATSVRPNKMMEKTKEDSWNTYENRFVYTLMDMTWEFVDKRYEAIFAAMNEEFGAHLVMSTDAHSYQEHITANVELRIQQEEDLLSSDKKNESIFSRIARLHRILGTFRSSTFAKTMAKFGKIKPPLVRTNAIAKNPNFKACHKLWNFILAYTDVGYKIDIFEQSTDIDDGFQKDIMHSILFDYVILKNYLQANEDRVIDTSRAYKKKALKPRYIREIVEEIVKNYDLPDVEIRKVLIEEITKAQLMQEEEKERQRLVEEKEKEIREREKKEKAEAARKAQEEERERIRKQKEEEKEAARRERERLAEEARKQKEQERLEQEEAERISRYWAELEQMPVNRQAVLDRRAAEAERLLKIEAENEAARARAAAKALEAEEKARAKALAEEEKAKAKALEAEEKAKVRAAAAAEREKAKALEAEAKAKEKAKAKALADKEKAKAKALADKEKAKAKELAEKEKAKEKAKAEKIKEREKAAAQKAKEKEKAKAKALADKEKAKAKAEKEKEKAKTKENGKAKQEDAALKDTELFAAAEGSGQEELLPVREAEPAVPEVTEEPEASTEPEVTKEPEASTEPEVTKEPEASTEPEVTEEPEVTAESEVTEEPEVTAESEVTEKPEITAESEVTEEPDFTETVIAELPAEEDGAVPAEQEQQDEAPDGDPEKPISEPESGTFRKIWKKALKYIGK